MSVLGWYLYPETKGIRFEKLDELYAAGIKPRHFKKHAQLDAGNHVGEKHDGETVEAEKTA